MPNVRILSERLSNQIAAGEVVERPVSVVKELLENAIDAGASRIKVYVEKGGKDLIRVMDDGCGMRRDDAMLCVERYATSKLSDDADLFRIQTLGFRGEALPSIASVSNFTLISRPADSDVATKVVMKGGKLMDVREEGAPRGTDIMVEDLFFNTPARKKFLKADVTELGHITDLVNAMALAYPHIYLELFHNGRSIRQLTEGSPYYRVLAVLGQTLKDALFEVRYKSDVAEVSGYIGDPALARKSAMGIYTFVNGRFVKNAALFQALRDGYHQRLVKGLYPMGVLHLKMPYNLVDVNVHPAKTLVRFAEQNKVFYAVKQATALALGSAPLVSHKEKSEASPSAADAAMSFAEAMAIMETAPEVGIIAMSEAGAAPANDRSATDTAAPMSKPAAKEQTTHSGMAGAPVGMFATDEDIEELPGDLVFKGGKTYDLEDILADVIEDDPADGEIDMPEVAAFNTPISVPLTAPSAPELKLWSETIAGWRILGQFRNSYIVCESGPELLLVDQHAAHERIAYERLTEAAKGRKADAQFLLMPEIIELSYREADAINGFLEEFASYGLEIVAFGGNSFAVKALPPFLDNGSVRQLLVELSEQIMLKGEVEDIMDECRKTIACHSVIRAHQALTMKEMQQLLLELGQCHMPQSCPHGRPSFISWGQSDIEKEFRRKL